jgi:hypothetical protein
MPAVNNFRRRRREPTHTARRRENRHYHGGGRKECVSERWRPAASSQPIGVALDGAGKLFLADEGSERIQRVDASTMAGSPSPMRWRSRDFNLWTEKKPSWNVLQALVVNGRKARTVVHVCTARSANTPAILAIRDLAAGKRATFRCIPMQRYQPGKKDLSDAK